MIKKRVKTNDGEPLTLEGLMNCLNALLKNDNNGDIKNILDKHINDSSDVSDDEEVYKHSGMIPYRSLSELFDDVDGGVVKDVLGNEIPVIAFVSTPQMLDGVVDTMRKMTAPTIVGYEKGVIYKAFVACGDARKKFIENFDVIPALMFDEQSGMCRLSINSRDGYDFIIGENGVTRFIIFDEAVCPAIIPSDIVSDDRKWGKRMTSELPKMIEKRIEESKEKTPLCNLPENCEFNTMDSRELVKKPLIADIMKDFADAKGSGKIGKDTFVEFMKPENKEAVASAVATSIAERQNPSYATVEPNSDEVFANDVLNAFTNSSYSERWKRNSDTEKENDDFSEEDTNPDCFRCIAEYMAKEGVDSISFWTDGEGLIHCDV